MKWASSAHWLDFVDHVKQRIVPSHNGRLVKSLGDGILLDFADVRSGVSAALAIQQERHRANSARAADRQIMLRTGIGGERRHYRRQTTCWAVASTSPPA